MRVAMISDTRRGALRRRIPRSMILLLLPLVTLAASCGGLTGGERPVVAVGFESQQWLVEQIAGDDFETVVLMPPGSDPEMFDTDMRAMRGLERADLYLTTSTIGFESRLAERIRENYPTLDVADISEGVEILLHTHSIAGAAEDHDEDHDEDHGHDHEDGACEAGDPHILSSLRNTRIVARKILTALIRLNPTRSEEYSRNFALLDQRLLSSDAEAKSLIAFSRGGAFVTMHPILGYYARDYGLTQIPLETDGKEATPRQLGQMLAAASKRAPAALFYERGHNERQANQMAAALGIKAYPLQLNGADFIGEIERVARIIDSDRIEKERRKMPKRPR